MLGNPQSSALNDVSLYKYRGVLARQSPGHKVVVVAVPISEVCAFALVRRACRTSRGQLEGFQRPQVRSHIREIRDYLSHPEAVLPNPIVIGFVEGVKIRTVSRGIAEVSIDTRDGPRGMVIDGQQRLSALAGLPGKDFEVLVTILQCRDVEDLRGQFVLINRTRPLPRGLIRELLPGRVSSVRRNSRPSRKR
jgi:DGQHR domain-containing protein